jgi:uncharacterized RDD family membrane protein YckC
MENRVGFWPRVAASLIDFVIVAVLAFLLKGLAASLLPDVLERKIAEATAAPAAARAKDFTIAMATWSVAMALIGPLYGLMEGFLGYSPAKLALGLRIVGESGHPAPRATLLVRYLVKSSAALIGLVALFVAGKTLEQVSMVVSLAIFAGCFLVLTKARQAVHDKIAGTAVLRKSDVAVTAMSVGQPSSA